MTIRKLTLPLLVIAHCTGLFGAACGIDNGTPTEIESQTSALTYIGKSCPGGTDFHLTPYWLCTAEHPAASHLGIYFIGSDPSETQASRKALRECARSAVSKGRNPAKCKIHGCDPCEND